MPSEESPVGSQVRRFTPGGVPWTRSNPCAPGCTVCAATSDTPDTAEVAEINTPTGAMYLRAQDRFPENAEGFRGINAPTGTITMRASANDCPPWRSPEPYIDTEGLERLRWNWSGVEPVPATRTDPDAFVPRQAADWNRNWNIPSLRQMQRTAGPTVWPYFSDNDVFEARVRSWANAQLQQLQTPIWFDEASDRIPAALVTDWIPAEPVAVSLNAFSKPDKWPQFLDMWAMIGQAHDARVFCKKVSLVDGKLHIGEASAEQETGGVR